MKLLSLLTYQRRLQAALSQRVLRPLTGSSSLRTLTGRHLIIYRHYQALIDDPQLAQDWFAIKLNANMLKEFHGED